MAYPQDHPYVCPTCRLQLRRVGREGFFCIACYSAFDLIGNGRVMTLDPAMRTMTILEEALLGPGVAPERRPLARVGARPSCKPS